VLRSPLAPAATSLGQPGKELHPYLRGDRCEARLQHPCTLATLADALNCKEPPQATPMYPTALTPYGEGRSICVTSAVRSSAPIGKCYTLAASCSQPRPYVYLPCPCKRKVPRCVPTLRRPAVTLQNQSEGR